MNDCKPIHRPGAVTRAGRDVLVEATVAITGKRFVNLTGPYDPTVGVFSVAPATAGSASFGVAREDVPAGYRAAVIHDPGTICPVRAGGTIETGDEVEVGNGGTAVVLASGVPQGRAVSDAVNGADVIVSLY